MLIQKMLLITAVLTGFSWSITDSFTTISNILNLSLFIYLVIINKLKVWNADKRVDISLLALVLWRVTDSFILKKFKLEILIKNIKFIFDISPLLIFRSGLWKPYYQHILYVFVAILTLITLLSFLEFLGFLRIGLIENGDLFGFHRNHIKSGFIWGIASIITLIMGIKRNRLFLIIFPLMLAGLMLTHARSYYLGFSAAVLFTAFLIGIKYSFRYMLYASSGLILMGVTILSIESVRQRFFSIFTGISSDESIKCRIIFIKEALRVFTEKPLAGLGYTEWSSHFSKLGYNCPDYHVHNIYLHELAEVGLLGFLLLTFFLIYILFHLSIAYIRQEESSEYILIGASVLVIFSVGGLFEPNLVKTIVMVPTFTLVGMALSVIKYTGK